jgi:membrane protease YdiL (CAAX protease family)
VAFFTRHARGFLGLGVFSLIWGAAMATLAVTKADGFEDALAVMGIIGVGFSLVGWLVTLGGRAPDVPVRRPGLELGAVLAFLVLYAVLFIGWGLSAFKAAVPPGQTYNALMLALKLVVHVVLPAGLIVAVGGQLRPLIRARADTRGFWLGLVVLGAALLGLLSVITPALKQISGLHLSPAMTALALAGTFVWMALEAGLCEEFQFRAVLQTRLAAAMKSEMAAVVIGALVFAMVHVPGLWLRSGGDVAGHSQSLLAVSAYAIAVLSPAGVFLGVMWMRTRSLLLVILLHAIIDVLPNTAEFAHTWLG